MAKTRAQCPQMSGYSFPRTERPRACLEALSRRHSNNTNTYVSLEGSVSDNLLRLESLVRTEITALFGIYGLPDEFRPSLWCKDTRMGLFYLMPKIHKATLRAHVLAPQMSLPWYC